MRQDQRAICAEKQARGTSRPSAQSPQGWVETGLKRDKDNSKCMAAHTACQYHKRSERSQARNGGKDSWTREIAATSPKGDFQCYNR